MPYCRKMTMEEINVLQEKNLDIKKLWKEEYTYSFVVTFIMGLITHIYKFTNNLPNHDSMYNFYSDQNILGSGRWFLSIACGFSSFYDLPWVNGLLSILFIALTVIVILNLFDVKNKFLIILINGLIVTYPATTEILCFEFTADGYMIGMFLSALSVHAIVKGLDNNKKIVPIAVSSILMCLSCGIYQAYVSFGLVLFICYFIWIILKQQYKTKEYLNYAVSMMIVTIVSLALYYVIWKVCMLLNGVQANDYQGISSVGALNINDILSAPVDIVRTFFSLFLEKNILEHGISLYAVFNLLFILFAAITLIIAVKKSKAHKNMFKLISVLVCLVAIPIVVCMWRFTSADVNYALRMLQSVVLVYIFVLIICFEYIKTSWFKLMFNCLAVAMVFNLFVQANIAYYYLNYEYETTYSEALELKYSLNNALREYGKEHKIAIIGHREADVALDQSGEANGSFMYTNMIEKSFLMDRHHTENFLQNVLYFDGEFADSETIAKIESTDDYAEMAPFFEEGQIKIIDDTITVKLG